MVEFEKQGKALVVFPQNCFGINTLRKNREGLEALYREGYRDAKK